MLEFEPAEELQDMFSKDAHIKESKLRNKTEWLIFFKQREN